MTANRIEKLRAALERIMLVSDEDSPAYGIADEALDQDEKARLCAPAEVVTQP